MAGARNGRAPGPFKTRNLGMTHRMRLGKIATVHGWASRMARLEPSGHHGCILRRHLLSRMPCERDAPHLHDAVPQGWAAGPHECATDGAPHKSRV